MPSKPSLHVLHVEDNDNDAELVRAALEKTGCELNLLQVKSAGEYADALDFCRFDLILSDRNVPGFGGESALDIALKRVPGTPFVYVSGSVVTDADIEVLKRRGASDFVPKSHLSRLPGVVEKLVSRAAATAPFSRPVPERTIALDGHTGGYLRAMERLVVAVRDLSAARTLEEITGIVRKAARDIAGSDGATFVLRDGDRCHYVDEDAIAPLWKGKKFPMTACISGWVMLNKTHAIIEDIHGDSRIPIDAYRPTFVKSLVMVPIRGTNPIGAIGNYWSHRHRPTDDEVRILRSLADTAAVALESVGLISKMDAKVNDLVRDKTAHLEMENRELQSFSQAVSHDLKAPLRHIEGFSNILREDYAGRIDPKSRDYLDRIAKSVTRMSRITDDLLHLSRITQKEVVRSDVDLVVLAKEVLAELAARTPGRAVEVVLPATLHASCDEGLVRIALENLFSNAWKYSSKRERARIELGARMKGTGVIEYYIRDNGDGFDPARAGKLFETFRRMHTDAEFEGTGVGLSTVRRIVRKHGGDIRAEAAKGVGATFFFTLVGNP